MFRDGTRRPAGITAAVAVACLIPATASAATITVDTTDGAAVGNSNCSIREAVLAANSDSAEDGCHRGSGRDTIAFDLAGSSLIALTQGVPVVKGPVTIDGTTEPDYAGNPIVRIDGGDTLGKAFKASADEVTLRGLVVTNFSNTAIRLNGNRGVVAGNLIGVEEDGDSAGGGGTGVYVLGKDSRIGGAHDGDPNVISSYAAHGIFVGGAGTRIEGNFIGTDPTGTSARPNGSQLSGTDLFGGMEIHSAGARITDNLISGNNGWGIYTGGPETVVRGNVIGLTASGGGALPNTEDGIRVGGPKTTVGGPDLADRNLLSASGDDGIEITEFADKSRVLGNYIGTDSSGDADRGNSADGVDVAGARGVVIGGDEPGEPNRIAYNADAVSISGAGAVGNSILGNLAFENGEQAIDLGDDGITPNDPSPDADTGPNHLQNFPVLVGGNEQEDKIYGSLDSAPKTRFRIECFIGPQSGDTKLFAGATTVKTNGNGHVDFAVQSPEALLVGDFLTATATVLDGDDPGDTSELSDDADVSLGP